MIEKIISGGQTGADQGALEAAEELGIDRGGWIPKGCITENGPDPELAARFGLKEHPRADYVPRTYANAKDSDATIIFSSNFKSRGTVCTLNAAKQYKRPYMSVLVDGKEQLDEQIVEDFKVWVSENNIKVLNVAGNRESKSPGIQRLVKGYIKQLCEGVKHGD